MRSHRTRTTPVRAAPDEPGSRAAATARSPPAAPSPPAADAGGEAVRVSLNGGLRREDLLHGAAVFRHYDQSPLKAMTASSQSEAIF